MQVPYLTRFNPEMVSRSYDEICEIHRLDAAAIVGSMIESGEPVRVLDIGSGNSSFGQELGEVFPDVQFYGVDPYGDVARGFDPETRASNIHFLEADGYELPIASNSIDFAITTWGPSFFGPSDSSERSSMYIDEIGRVLKSTGIASVLPEVGEFKRRPLEEINHMHGFVMPHMTRKAQAYMRLRRLGFTVRFSASPDSARIFGPDNIQHHYPSY